MCPPSNGKIDRKACVSTSGIRTEFHPYYSDALILIERLANLRVRLAVRAQRQGHEGRFARMVREQFSWTLECLRIPLRSDPLWSAETERAHEASIRGMGR